MAVISQAKLPSDQHHGTIVMISQHWCLTAPSHYLNQCWSRSLPPYGVTRPQWVNDWTGDSGSVLIRPILWTNDDKAARCHMAPHGHSRFTFSKTFSHRQDSFQFYINIIIRSPGKAIPQKYLKLSHLTVVCVGQGRELLKLRSVISLLRKKLVLQNTR